MEDSPCKDNHLSPTPSVVLVSDLVFSSLQHMAMQTALTFSITLPSHQEETISEEALPTSTSSSLIQVRTTIAGFAFAI